MEIIKENQPNTNDEIEKYKDIPYIKEYLNNPELNYKGYSTANFYNEFREKKDQIVIMSEKVNKIWLVGWYSLDNVNTIVFLNDGPAPKHNMERANLREIDFVFHTANFLKGKHLLFEGCRYIINNYDNFGDKENFIKLLKAKTDKMKKFRIELLGPQDDNITHFMLSNKLFSFEELNSLLNYNINQNTKIAVLDAINNSSEKERKDYAAAVDRKEEIDLGITEYSLKDLKATFACCKKDNKIVITQYKGTSSTIVIPGSVDGITEFVFKSINLKEKFAEIIFDEGVTKVFIDESCNHAFTKAKFIRSIQLPSTLTHIDSEIFSKISYSCTIDISRVKDPNFKYIDKHYLCYKNRLLFIKGREDIREIVLPEKITEIAEFSFQRCKKLTKVTLHNKLTRFEEFSFSFSRKITSIELPDCVKHIPDEAFRECDRLETIDFNNVTSIGVDAFKKCMGLIDVVLPEQITSIQDGAFSYCRYLESIKFPSTITKLSYGVLACCSSLSYFEIPNTVTLIDSRALSACDFHEIEIPKSVKVFGFAVFEYCDDITVHVPEEVDDMEQTFYSCFDFKIITPKPTVEKQWHKDYKDEIEYI